MTNMLLINEINNNNYTYSLTFSSDNLDTAYTIYFNSNNVDWMDDSSFVISGGSNNSVIEGKIYVKNNEYKIFAKLFVWDSTINGHVTKTYVSVMKITSESINYLKLSK